MMPQPRENLWRKLKLMIQKIPFLFTSSTTITEIGAWGTTLHDLDMKGYILQLSNIAGSIDPRELVIMMWAHVDVEINALDEPTVSANLAD